jgi:isopentenyl-diphosphate Delta-isomerase
MEELIDIVLPDGAPTGRQLTKHEAHQTGARHLGAHVWIFTEKGELLVQQRDANNYIYPSLWHVSAAGHVAAGEAPIQAARRELAEELGIEVQPDELIPVGIWKNRDVEHDGKWLNNEIISVYLLPYNGTEFTFTDGEVQAVQFVAADELLREVNRPQQKTYTPHAEYYAFVVHAMKKLILAHRAA